jgi:hypothetical protein
MGGLLSKTDKTKEEIIHDIQRINTIASNDLFVQKCGYKLHFIVVKSFFQSVIAGKFIYCYIVKIKNKFFLV